MIFRFLILISVCIGWGNLAQGDEFDPPSIPNLDAPPSQLLDPFDDTSSSAIDAPIAPAESAYEDNNQSSGNEGTSTPKKKTSDFQENRTTPETLYKEPPIKAFTTKELQSLCKEWAGKTVSYFKDVYQLKNDCTREKLKDVDVKRMTVEGRKITNLNDGKVLAAFSLNGGRADGDAVNILKQMPKTCQEMKQKYVTVSGNTFFYVDDQCVRKGFPDGMSYEDHRTKNKKTRPSDLLIVDEQDLARVTKLGKEMPSVGFKPSPFTGKDTEPQHLSINEACKGIIGKVVSVYQNLFLVKPDPKSPIKGACSLEKLNAEAQSRKTSGTKPIELTSSQALSIPIR